MSGPESISTTRPLEPQYNRDETEAFTFLSPFSNLDLYPHMDHPPYFDMRRCPTMLDVIKVRHYLSARFPTEIIDVIVDLAEYWPHTSSILDMTTRIYHDRMNYGSYGRGPKTWWHKRHSTPEMRREWQDKGFVLRTPPIGMRCIQGDDPRKGYVRSLLAPSKKRTKKGKAEIPDWLPPRGKHPARAIWFEILGREERPSGPPGYRLNPRTSLEASVDNIKWPQGKRLSAREPLRWTTEAATTKTYHRNSLDTKEKLLQYTFIPRQSSSANPSLTQAFPVFWNRDALNRKSLVTYRYDDTTPYSPEKERFLSGDIVRGFLRSLREGDSIALWGRAWEGEGPCCNVIDRVKIHVFWAV